MGRHSLLLIDNFTAHKTNVQLLNITICRFAPNVTSKIQPLDMGKYHQRKSKDHQRKIQNADDPMSFVEHCIGSVLLLM